MTTNPSDLLAGLAGPEPAAMQTLHDRLVAKAEADGILDVAYRTIPTPLGTLLLAATRRGLVRVAFETERPEAVLELLSTKLSPRVLNAPPRLDPAARQLEEYFAGKRRHFELPLDLSLSSGFRRAVLDYLPSITYGHTASYGEVAGALAHPRAMRAVGTACATNPLPLVIPCHRVIRADGTIGPYRGGTEAKAQLLTLEGAR